MARAVPRLTLPRRSHLPPCLLSAPRSGTPTQKPGQACGILKACLVASRPQSTLCQGRAEGSWPDQLTSFSRRPMLASKERVSASEHPKGWPPPTPARGGT